MLQDRLDKPLNFFSKVRWLGLVAHSIGGLASATREMQHAVQACSFSAIVLLLASPACLNVSLPCPLQVDTLWEEWRRQT